MDTTSNLQVSINDINFNNPVLNAAGVRCQSTTELDAILASTAGGGAVTKSATLQPRNGNETPRMQSLPFGSINSMGGCLITALTTTWIML